MANAVNIVVRLTIDAIVMATAILLDSVLITQDAHDFQRLAWHFQA